MNKVILIGNMTRDPELRTTRSGTSVCSFTIAVNRNYTDANGERQADFIGIQTWRGLAESCAQYLSKGRKIAVSGSLQSRTYDDKDGNKRTVLEVVADEVEFLITKNDGQDSQAQQPSKAAPKPEQTRMGMLTPAPDDLPF